MKTTSSELKVGDLVIVINSDIFSPSIKIGDLAEILEITNSYETVLNISIKILTGNLIGATQYCFYHNIIKATTAAKVLFGGNFAVKST